MSLIYFPASNGYIWETLKQPIYHGKNVVKEIYWKNKKCYPEEDIDDISFKIIKMPNKTVFLDGVDFGFTYESNTTEFVPIDLTGLTIGCYYKGKLRNEIKFTEEDAKIQKSSYMSEGQYEDLPKIFGTKKLTGAEKLMTHANDMFVSIDVPKCEIGSVKVTLETDKWFHSYEDVYYDYGERVDERLMDLLREAPVFTDKDFSNKYYFKNVYVYFRNAGSPQIKYKRVYYLLLPIQIYAFRNMYNGVSFSQKDVDCKMNFGEKFSPEKYFDNATSDYVLVASGVPISSSTKKIIKRPLSIVTGEFGEKNFEKIEDITSEMDSLCKNVKDVTNYDHYAYYGDYEDDYHDFSDGYTEDGHPYNYEARTRYKTDTKVWASYSNPDGSLKYALRKRGLATFEMLASPRVGIDSSLCHETGHEYVADADGYARRTRTVYPLSPWPKHSYFPSPDNIETYKISDSIQNKTPIDSLVIVANDASPSWSTKNLYESSGNAAITLPGEPNYTISLNQSRLSYTYVENYKTITKYLENAAYPNQIQYLCPRTKYIPSEKHFIMYAIFETNSSGKTTIKIDTLGGFSSKNKVYPIINRKITFYASYDKTITEQTPAKFQTRGLIVNLPKGHTPAHYITMGGAERIRFDMNKMSSDTLAPEYANWVRCHLSTYIAGLTRYSMGVIGGPHYVNDMNSQFIKKEPVYCVPCLDIGASMYPFPVKYQYVHDRTAGIWNKSKPARNNYETILRGLTKIDSQVKILMDIYFGGSSDKNDYGTVLTGKEEITTQIADYFYQWTDSQYGGIDKQIYNTMYYVLYQTGHSTSNQNHSGFFCAFELDPMTELGKEKLWATKTVYSCPKPTYITRLHVLYDQMKEEYGNHDEDGNETWWPKVDDRESNYFNPGE